MGESNSLLPLMACTVCKATFLFVRQLSDLLIFPIVAAVLLPMYLTFNDALRTPNYINYTEEITACPPYWTFSVIDSEL